MEPSSGPGLSESSPAAGSIAGGRRARARVRVEGIVQGVGFRPFVYSLATSLRLGGIVGNDTTGVFVEVEGDLQTLDRFLDAVRQDPPPLAVIERFSIESIEPTGERSFRIVESTVGGERHTLISPDIATCDDCLRELFDPADRRYRFAFVNCTNCGPRFTITRDVPYDRPLTTMAGFVMCEACAREYRDPADRRFHAQPTCCPACGPALSLIAADGSPIEGDPIVLAANMIEAGQVLAVKGLGGYHLAVDAGSEPAAFALRSRKRREDKPFAVMATSLEQAHMLCFIDSAEERLLTGPRRPIVLLERRRDAPVASAVAPATRRLGVMLPYTPLHHLLAAELGRAFVLTSGNVSDEPIAYDDGEARGRLSSIADAFLTHDRPIHIRTDDSVVRAFRSEEMVLRRSRGFVPHPVSVSWEFPRPVLACGAELKNTFALAKGRRVFVSHHIGDLENYETLRSFTDGISHFKRSFDVEPDVVAHDLHPEYLSTKYAMDQGGVELLGVQHHHAHVASCLADNGDEGPVIGVAFDGLGLGTDGTLWGGEFLVADLAGFQRVGHFDPVPMPGGVAAIREPWRMAASFLDAAFGERGFPYLDVVRRNESRWSDIVTIARAGANSPLTSSVGRLFDAVAAILGVRDSINYEGQAAIEMEQLADARVEGSYSIGIRPGEDGGPFRLQGIDLVRAAAEDLLAGSEPSAVAGRFHRAVAQAIVDGAEILRQWTGLATVALSGGVFQNVLLLERTVPALEDKGFRVLVHSRVPPNDGGISLGQAVVAAARDRREGGRG